jgi:hypothetical protein
MWVVTVWRFDIYSGWKVPDEIPSGVRFSPVQIGPGVHPAFSTTGNASFLGVKRQWGGVDHPPHPPPKLKKE